MPDPFDHCEALLREGDKDRFLPTLFAPPKYRRALFALYAFNLEVARTRELAREPMPGEIRLQWWREVLGGIGRGDVDAHPAAAAIRDVVVREEPLLLKPGQLYFLATLVGCAGFVVLTYEYGYDVELSAYGAITVTMLLRVLAIRFNWRTSAFGLRKRS